jgi:uncharacterized protein
MQINFPEAPPGSLPPSQKVFRVFTWHKRNGTGEEVPFDLSDESDGTRKLFEFTGGWLRALTIGATLFVDELDRSLHPLERGYMKGRYGAVPMVGKISG